MGLVSDVGTNIDAALQDYTRVVFTGVTGPIHLLLSSMALLGLLFIAVNHIIQFRSINYSVYLHWLLRYLLIYAFATIWVNFHGIYNIFVEVPADYSALMLKAVGQNMQIKTLRTDILDPSLIHDTYSAMDEFGHAIVWIAYDFLRDTSIWDIGNSIKNVFIGALTLIIGGIFLAACAIIVLMGKIGFAVAMSLAPLAIIMLMMDQTKHHFDSWLRFTIGFVVLPLLTAALMAIVLYAAGEALAGSGASSANKAAFFGFLFIMIAALALLFQLPTMASTLAAASVAAVGAGALFAAKSMITRNTMSAFNKAFSAGQRLRDGAGVANQARKAGASPKGIAMSAISGMRQSALLRQDRRNNRLAGRIIGGDSKTTAPPRRYETKSESQSSGNSSGGSGRQDSAEQQNLNRDF